MTIQEEIRNKIEGLLNDNNEGIIFKVSLYEDLIDDKLFYEEYEINNYNVSKIRYIPVVIEDIIGEYADIRGVDLSEPDIILSFLIPTKQASIQDTLAQYNTTKLLKIFDDLRFKMNSQVINLGKVGYQIYDDEALFLEPNTGSEIVDYFEMTFKPEYQSKQYIFDSQDLKVGYSTSNIVVRIGSLNYTTPFEYGKEYKVVVSNNGSLSEIIINGGVVATSGITEFNLGKTVILNAFEGKIYDLKLGDNGATRLFINDFTNLSNNEYLEMNYDDSNYDVISFGDSGDITMTFNSLRPTTNQFTYGDEGLLFRVYDTIINSTLTKDLILGNHIRHFLDGVEIFPTSKNASYTSETQGFQKGNDKTSTSIVSENVMGGSLTLVYSNNPHIKKIFRHAFKKEKEQNKTYKLEVHFGSFKESYDVLIENGATDPTDNSPAFVTLTYRNKLKNI